MSTYFIFEKYIQWDHTAFSEQPSLLCVPASASLPPFSLPTLLPSAHPHGRLEDPLARVELQRDTASGSLAQLVGPPVRHHQTPGVSGYTSPLAQPLRFSYPERKLSQHTFKPTPNTSSTGPGSFLKQEDWFSLGLNACFTEVAFSVKLWKMGIIALCSTSEHQQCWEPLGFTASSAS